MDVRDVWQQTLNLLREKIADEDMRAFVLPLRPIGQYEATLILEAPTRSAADAVRQHYREVIEAALARTTSGSLLQMNLRVPVSGQQELFPAPSGPHQPTSAKASGPAPPVVPKYPLEN